MGTAELVGIIVRLAAGAITTFLAILLWAKTRDTAWMLIIMGVIFEYGEIIYSTLTLFGVVPANVYIIPEVLKVDVVMLNLPLGLFAAGFIVMLFRSRLE
ncbi:MAG: hypothetical protein SVR04_10460 [Spirochaetota bacterium]|jgi:hypothetical protein|nr:hypothetical protein [Spirochaetota bacterium]